MEVRISDHALLRYIERVAGVDVEALRGKLVAQLARGAGAAGKLDADHYVVRFPDAGYVVRGGVCVTVLTHDMGCASLGDPASAVTR